MSFLNSLKFTADNQPSPIERKRAKLISNLKDQLTRLENPHHAKIRMQWVKGDGEKRLVEKRTPVRPWWRETIDGQVAFFVRSGLKKVEFEKGMTAILIPNLAALPALIQGLIEATEQGELHHLIAPKDEQRKAPRKKVI